MDQPSRILIVRPSALGDVCRTVPVLASLRAAYPAARIDWVVQDTFAPAVAGHPALDRVIEFPRGSLDAWWRHPAVAWRARRWLADLRLARYELVIDCQGLGRSGLITFATRAPRRVGFRSAKEFAWLGYNVRHADPPTPDDTRPVHTVDRMLALLEAQGTPVVRDMRLYVAEHDRRSWAQRRARQGGAGPYVVLAPTSRWMSKRWPIEHWRAIIAPLVERGFERVIVIGSPSEREQAAGVTALVPEHVNRVINLAGMTTIPQTMAVIADAALVIANDSAPLHMAVGLGRPCIGLYGPTDPAVVGPYRRPEAVIRAPGIAPAIEVNFKARHLGDQLMRQIKPAAVLSRIDEVLAHPAPVPGAGPVIEVNGVADRVMAAPGHVLASAGVAPPEVESRRTASTEPAVNDISSARSGP